MKWAVLALAGAVALAGILHYHGRKIRADQGFVKSDDGKVWRMTRMQTLGIGSEFVAVYERAQ